jgi:hypothetical protein
MITHLGWLKMHSKQIAIMTGVIWMLIIIDHMHVINNYKSYVTNLIINYMIMDWLCNNIH